MSGKTHTDIGDVQTLSSFIIHAAAWWLDVSAF